MSKTVEHYLALPYAISFLVDEDGDIVAKVRELPGCAAHGKTTEEAYTNIAEAMSLWIEDALERDDTIPAPFVDRSEGVLDNFKRLYLSPDRIPVMKSPLEQLIEETAEIETHTDAESRRLLEAVGIDVDSACKRLELLNLDKKN